MSDTGDKGERIAKVLARRGVASRRAAEAMIAEGRVAVNGKVIASPALNVRSSDRIAVDGKPVAEAEPPRLWLYHKPPGLVTTEKDEKGRPTVFGALPPEIGRVVSVGRLDLNSEGLLLLTNDGGLKRRLELPSTGWLRKYRVRVHGEPSEATLAPLRRGISIGTERFQPMEVALDRQQGTNAWLTVGLREGKNREVRRAMEAVGLTVNRLIRIGYGPFRLGELKPGEVEEVRRKVLRDQIGEALFEEFSADEPARRSPRVKAAESKSGKSRPESRPQRRRAAALETSREAAAQASAVSDPPKPGSGRTGAHSGRQAQGGTGRAAHPGRTEGRPPRPSGKPGQSRGRPSGKPPSKPPGKPRR